MHDMFKRQRGITRTHSVAFIASARDFADSSERKKEAKVYFDSTGVKTTWYRRLVGQKLKTSEVEAFIEEARERWQACVYAYKLHCNGDDLESDEKEVYDKYIGEIQKDYTAEKKRLSTLRKKLRKSLRGSIGRTSPELSTARGQLAVVHGQLGMFSDDIAKNLSSQFLNHHKTELWRRYSEWRDKYNELDDSREIKSSASLVMTESKRKLDVSLDLEEEILKKWEADVDRLEEHVQGNPSTGTSPEAIYEEITRLNVQWHNVQEEIATLWKRDDSAALYQLYLDSKLSFYVEVEAMVVDAESALHALKTLIELSHEKEQQLKLREDELQAKVLISRAFGGDREERAKDLAKIFGLKLLQKVEQSRREDLDAKVSDTTSDKVHVEESVDPLADKFAQMAEIQEKIKAKILHYDVKVSSDRKYLEDMKRLIALSRAQIAEARIELDELRKLPKRVTGAIVYLQAADATFPVLLKTIRVFKSGTRLGIASTDFTLMLGLSFGVTDPSGKAGATVGLAIEIGLGMNVGDDRRLRAKVSFAAKAIASVEFPKVFAAEAVLTLYSVTRTDTFADDYHLAATLTHKLAYWKAFLKGAIENGEHNNDTIDRDRAAELLTFAQKVAQGTALGDGLKMYYALARLPYVRCVGWTFLDIALGLEGASASIGVEATPMNLNTFYRYDPAKEYTKGSWIICPVEKMTGRVGYIALSFGFGNFTGVAKYTYVGDDPNPDNGGHYFYLSLSHCSSAEIFKADPGADPVEIPGLEEKMSELCKDLEKVSDRLPEDKGNWTTWMGALEFEKLVSKAPLSLVLELGVTIEANFVFKNGLFRLQYVRAVANYANVSTEAHIPIGVSGVNVDLQASYAMSASLFEIPGTNTLTYLGTVHNGFNTDSRNVPERRLPLADHDDTGRTLWDEYTAKHKGRIWAAMCRLTDTSTNTWKEAQEDFENTGGPALCVSAGMSGLKKGTEFNKSEYESLLEEMTTMFDKGNREALANLDTSNWTLTDSEDQESLLERDIEALEELKEPEPEPEPKKVEPSMDDLLIGDGKKQPPPPTRSQSAFF